ncbi:MAG: hypothetical protein AAF353_06900 [Pseudomonadota bacterium]
MKKLVLMILMFVAAPSQAGMEFVQCYDFGCKTTQEIGFSDSQWAQLRDLFEHRNLDVSSEKQAIRQAIAVMETFSGEITGTNQDKGGNYPGSDIPRQMDCIDESTNTFQYLMALENRNLLKWHRVDLKQRRIVWFAAHWTATVREVGSDQIYAVDSWYRDNGELPYIQPIADWRRKRSFPATYNPELAKN